jgi:hypothetical protein
LKKLKTFANRDLKPGVSTPWPIDPAGLTCALYHTLPASVKGDISSHGKNSTPIRGKPPKMETANIEKNAAIKSKPSGPDAIMKPKERLGAE